MNDTVANLVRARFRKPAYSFADRVKRGLWNLAWLLLFRATPRPMHSWRRFVLICFGAEIGPGCHIYPKAIIWAPWELRLGNTVAIADHAEVYNPSLVEIGDHAIISQGAYLCGASHDYSRWEFPLISKPIKVERNAWIAARCIVNMGVTIGEGCIIGAGSVVTKDMPAWHVCAGNPCRPIKGYGKS
jgi:putative colanic acid biosynthesis acetyltransferase WcaF